MEIQYRVATLNDVENAYHFSEQRFDRSLPEMERMMALWKVRWHKEALTHYFNIGWSFVAHVDGEMMGYFMAQPIIYFRGHTQTVWVEHLEAAQSEVQKMLIEIPIKVAREKNLQRVLFPNHLKDDLQAWRANALEEEILEVKTTKG